MLASLTLLVQQTQVSVIFFSLATKRRKGTNSCVRKVLLVALPVLKKQNKPCLLLGEVAIGTSDMCLGGYQLGK